jgi:DNA-directed RNA polymerase specialized sigma24 family protein
MPPVKKSSVQKNITADDFERFLVWLHADRNEAARAYEELRGRLILFFQTRGCPDAETLTDEVIDRVIGKVPELRKTGFDGKPLYYCYGVAKYVAMESARKPVPLDLEKERAAAAVPDEPDEEEARHRCLGRCLEKLDAKKRDILLRYHADETSNRIQGRKDLAREMGVDLNALRVQTHRIVSEVRKCMDACLDEKNARSVAHP